MKVCHVLAILVLSAAPALAQTKPVPRYGETDAKKSQGEIESERAADAAYRRSLGNVPNAGGSVDPWGTIRKDGPAKPAAKSTPPKQAN